MSGSDRTFNSFIKSAADVEPSEHKFLLGDRRFPIGEVSIIAASGGVGKGQTMALHTAYTSHGYTLRGIKTGEPLNSLIISAEDTASDVRRRLDRAAFKADMSKVYILDKLDSLEFGIDLSDPDDPFKLEALITATKSSLVYLDPLQSFVGEATDLSRQNHCRLIMHKLASIAERAGCCIVLLMHLNKRQSVASASDLLCGSNDIYNAARSVLLLTNDFKDGRPERRFLFHIKSNHSLREPTLELSINEQGNQVVGESDVTADDYVIAMNSRRVAKPSKAAPNYAEMFYNGIEMMIANGESQSTYREFISTYAPSFNVNGKSKYVIDDITPRVEERLGYTIQTSTSSNSPIKIGTERGFRLIRLT